MPVADVGALGRRQVLHRLSVEEEGARSRRVEEAEDGEERRLPRSGGADDGEPLALLHLEVDVGERMRLHLVGEEHLLDALHLEQRLLGLRHQLGVQIVLGNGFHL